MSRKDTEMQATNAVYHGSTARSRLFAAGLALAGSSAMLGLNLGIAEYYAVNAGAVKSMTASRGDAPHQIARIQCTHNAS
jgi:hypothetical protein